MFIYENEGFIEVEAKDIQQLCRSVTAVPFGPEDEGRHDLQVSLCEYLDQSVPRCRVAFYAKTLKRSFVFSVKGSEQQSSWQLGLGLLEKLGFQVSAVNLNLSPAMQEVVLRDIPGLATPEYSRNFRADHARFIDGLRADYEASPESVPGKKASLKLGTEDRLNKRAGELRHFLEELLSPQENLAVDLEILHDQVKDLTVRLEAADSLAEQERKQRAVSESITSAAEKRIQELEKILVDVETKTSNALTQKRNNVQLQGRIDALNNRLASAEEDLATERDKQSQFISDVVTAHEQIASLQESLSQTMQDLEEVRSLGTESEADRKKATVELNEAELRMKALDAKLQKADKISLQYDEIFRDKEVMSERLTAVQKELNDSLALNQKLQGELTSVVARGDEAERRLRGAEENRRRQNQDDEQLSLLAAKNQELTRSLEELRDEYAHECRMRKRLEKGAVEDERRIVALEEALSLQKETLSKPCVTDVGSAKAGEDVESLRSDLQEKTRLLSLEQAARQGLESDLDEAHKMVDSLEKMLRETEASAGGARGAKRPHASDNEQVQALEGQLKALEHQLELERLEQKRLAKAVVVAGKKLAEQEEQLLQAVSNQKGEVAVASVAEKMTVAAPVTVTKKLPHELRPAPKKGALFHPDWDLNGLPCGSVKQIDKAWEAVFNVQMSLEGYPSQYCMAFLIVLRLGNQKKVFLLYRLKLDKHTLVCIPAKTPKDEASLKKTIKEGMKFLQLSGFEMDEMSLENIESTLGTYFLEA